MLIKMMPKYAQILKQKENKKLVYETLWFLVNLTCCKSDSYPLEFESKAEEMLLFEILIGKEFTYKC